MSTSKPNATKRAPAPLRQDRRAILQMAALGAPVAALAGAAGAEPLPAAPRLSARGDACMSDTDHTRRYYELARF